MPERPLLTIAIPTYNRCAELQLLLSYIGPQVGALPQVELLIFDNASPDGTEAMVCGLVEAGLRCRYQRRPENIGPDANFLGCYNEASGRFVWLLGDDDVIFPGGLQRVADVLSVDGLDMVYVQPQGFILQPDESVAPDAKAPARVYANAADFVNAISFKGDLALTSAVIVNKDRVEAFPHPAFESGADSNLLQLGWTFACLLHLRKGAVLERGLLATCEKSPSRPFDMVKVFGTHWKQQAERFLGGDARLCDLVLQRQLDSWFVGNWIHMRRNGYARTTPNPAGQLRADYGRRLAFWTMVWPLLAWPLPVAKLWWLLPRALRRVQRKWFRLRAPSSVV